MGFLTSRTTPLPLSLHLASKMNEYTEVIGPWILPEEWNEGEPETEEDVAVEGVQMTMDFGGY